MTASFLTGFGHSTTEAGDGEAALDYLLRDRCDIVVADLAMPGMSGVELAAVIRERNPGLPVLILTGHADAMQIPEDLPVLAKPFRSADLAERVATLLAAADAGSAEPVGNRPVAGSVTPQGSRRLPGTEEEVDHERSRHLPAPQARQRPGPGRSTGRGPAGIGVFGVRRG